MLTLVGKLLYGKLSTELGLDSRLDIDDYSLHLSLKPLEKFVLIILSVIILVLGVYTKPLMVPIRKAILKHSLIKSEVSGGVNSVYAG
jgi:NADH:ubiquinone oxidoreductase subunit 4 (subunit M)